VVFGHLDSRTKPLFTFIRETGCRREEAVFLKYSQLDLARQEVVFHRVTKNARSRRVPLTDQAIWAIEAVSRHGEFVFYHPETLRKWKGDNCAVHWERARAKAGHNWLRIHDLRHAYGIKLAQAGCAMHYISEVMGHHSIDFTRTHYARFSPEFASRAVLKVLPGSKGRTAAKKVKVGTKLAEDVFHDQR
jgi:integrase